MPKGIVAIIAIISDIEVGQAQRMAKLMAENRHTHQFIIQQFITDEKTIEVNITISTLPCRIFLRIPFTGPDTILATTSSLTLTSIEHTHQGNTLLMVAITSGNHIFTKIHTQLTDSSRDHIARQLIHVYINFVLTFILTIVS